MRRGTSPLTAGPVSGRARLLSGRTDRGRCDWVRGRAARAARRCRPRPLLILTEPCTREVIGAQWGEVNLAERMWRGSANRTKAGTERRMPLSTAALVIV